MYRGLPTESNSIGVTGDKKLVVSNELVHIGDVQLLVDDDELLVK